jgi:dinuclear metal center YbgI/SA1388 family protein
MQLAELITHLEVLAPPALSEGWDNTGLLFGDRAADVSHVLTCLTLTPDVAAEAVANRVHLVVTHHPLLFKPVQRLTSDTAEGRTVLMLLRAGIAVYSPHTAWDNAPDGINQQLAELCGLQDIEPLRRSPTASQVKLVTFVPAEHLHSAQRAVWDAGCGVIGEYRECSYVLHGTGTFFGGESANPAVGQAGRLEQVEEARLEVVCPANRVDVAVAALRAAHPYEEPAIDIYPLQSLPGDSGAGRCGRLPSPRSLGDLAALVGQRLNVSALQFAGDPHRTVERLGIACGAAAEFWKDARRAGCQALLTGEARFHAALECREAGFGLIVAGHYATERHGMERLAALLAERCPGITVTASAVERDPLALLP